MGFRKGDQIKSLGMIRIISTRPEPLNAISSDDVAREGFPHWTPEQFVNMIVKHYGVSPSAKVNRIEFEYLDRFCSAGQHNA